MVVYAQLLCSPDQAFDVIEGLERLAATKGCSLSQFALAWCMQQPGVTSPIIAVERMSELAKYNVSRTGQ